MPSKIAAEFIRTFWLVLGGCGSAVLAAVFPQVGARRFARVRTHRAHRCLCVGAHLRRALQSRRFGWIAGRGTLPRVARPATTKPLRVVQSTEVIHEAEISAARTTFVACAVTAAACYGESPVGSTGECKDGTYSSAPSKRGACAGHGGVKKWYADKADAATAKAPAAPATAPPAAAPAKPAEKSSAVPATAAAGGGPGQVWVNTSSKVYHCQDDKWYGKTKNGEYMTEAAAKAAGNHADYAKACS